MNCPYCQARINAFTGLQEAVKFERHLASCRKNPNNVIIRNGRRSAAVPKRCQNLNDALEIRANSGQ